MCATIGVRCNNSNLYFNCRDCGPCSGYDTRLLEATPWHCLWPGSSISDQRGPCASSNTWHASHAWGDSCITPDTQSPSHLQHVFCSVPDTWRPGCFQCSSCTAPDIIISSYHAASNDPKLASCFVSNNSSSSHPSSGRLMDRGRRPKWGAWTGA
jgi:hypothetical protein